MEGTGTNSAYDYACCKRVWRRVAPGENPYPEAQTETQTAVEENGLAQLPGAQSDPCCMGTQARQSLDVLRGFVREELADRQLYLDFSKRAPTPEARRILREIARDEERHAERIKAVIYLITGECYRPHVCTEAFAGCGYCAMLRRLYHEEACGGFNYYRAGEETLDHCLSQIFSELSRDEYRHASRVLCLLERALRG